MTTQCCVCHRIRLGVHWVPEREAMPDPHTVYTHGYCPRCYVKALSEVLDGRLKTATADGHSG